MTTTAAPAAGTAAWTLNRVLFLIAGTVTLVGVVLSAAVSPWFLIVPGLVGANQLLLVATGWCPMSLLLARLGVGRPPQSSAASTV